ncbi:MmgE/PrpD family protein [Nitrospinota bacterium]
MSQTNSEINLITRELGLYITSALDRTLPPKAAEESKHHLLDTIAAIISGSRLRPGKMAINYIGLLGGQEEALVVGSGILTTAVNAALANGMSAHADETDDSHKDSRSHFGCSVVPAALAIAEKEGRSGEAMLRAVALGYDIGVRFNLALGPNQLNAAGHCAHSFGGLFGAAAAAGALAALDTRQIPWLLSYTAQQASGLSCYPRDVDHIEKAFIFGGMPARNGVTAATMVAAGFTGIPEILSGRSNFLSTFSPDPQPERLVEELGSKFEIVRTNIKKWSVGTPIQAALDSVEALASENDLRADEIERIVVRMSDMESHIVDNQGMPDVNLQHAIAVFLLDGSLSFDASHDRDRMSDPATMEMREKVELIPDPEQPRRQPLVEIAMRDGRKLSHRTLAVRGTPDNPMEHQEIERKAEDLLTPILGAQRSRELIDRIWNIEQETNVRDLRPLLMDENA